MRQSFFWSGNLALAEGALEAGLTFYAGYPITPSSDLMEHISRELPKRGGVFIQGEDEIASINMVIGASIGGAKAMTATSGPGFSLMQEALGMAIMLEVPLVVIDVMRLGPSTGQATKSGQGDVMQARWGRHGDQTLVVLAASSPQNAFYRIIEAFNIGEELRTPVVLLIDELTAHLWETVTIDRSKIKIKNRRYGRPGEPFFDSSDPRIAPPMPKLGEGYNVLFTTSTHDGFGIRKTQDPEVHKKLATRLKMKIWGNVDQIFRYNIYPNNQEDFDILIVSYCSTARAAKEAAELLNKNGIKAAALELETLWPVDYNKLGEYVNSSSVTLVPEMNLGQLIYDVKMVAKNTEIIGYEKIGGGIPIYPNELINLAREVLKR